MAGARSVGGMDWLGLRAARPTSRPVASHASRGHTPSETGCPCGGIGVGIPTAEESGVNRVESEVNRIASIETWNGSLSPICTPAVIKSPERVRRARPPEWSVHAWLRALSLRYKPACSF